MKKRGFKIGAFILVFIVLASFINVNLINAAPVDPNQEVNDPVDPVDEPTVEPTEEPIDEPTEETTVEPTPTPMAEPTPTPPPTPTKEPTDKPTLKPTINPTPTPTKAATPTPTVVPTVKPTPVPTDKPKPSEVPTIPVSTLTPPPVTPTSELKPGTDMDISEGLRGYTIRIAGWWDEEKDNAEVKKIINEFERKNNCNVLFMDLTREQIYNGLLESKATGRPFADAVFVESYDVLGKYMVNDLLAPMNIFYTKAQLDAIPESYLNILSKNNNLYGVPVKMPTFSGIWANLDYLASKKTANVSELYKNGNWTWEQFNQVMYATTLDLDNSGYFEDFGLSVGTSFYPGLMTAVGGNIVKWDGTKFVSDIQSERSYSALSFARDIYKYNYVADNNEKAFYRTYSGLLTGESWMVRDLKKYLNAELMFLPYPVVNANEPHIALATSAISVSLVESSQYKKETASLIKELYNATSLNKEKDNLLKMFNDRSKNTYENMLDNFTVDFSEALFNDTDIDVTILHDIVNNRIDENKVGNEYATKVNNVVNNRQKKVNLNRLPVNMEW